VEFIEQHPELVSAVLLWLVATFSTFMLYWINRLQGRQPISLFEIFNVDVRSAEARAGVIMADMLISSALGAILAVLLTTPTTPQQAVAAGLGLTGLISVYTREAGV